MFQICCPADFDYAHILRDSGATIYVNVEDRCFPDDQWWDLPLSVLEMWCWNLRRNAKLPSAEFSLCFMEGPYSIRCKKDRASVKMQFIQDEEILYESAATFDELKTAVYIASTELVSSLEKHGIVKFRRMSGLKKEMKKLNRLTLFWLRRK